jgi:hypothetical protein
MATSIALAPRTRDRLGSFGMAGHTYDEMRQAFMDEVDRVPFVDELHRFVDDPSVKWVDLEDDP